jgi:Amt family ammonium transporter
MNTRGSKAALLARGAWDGLPGECPSPVDPSHSSLLTPVRVSCTLQTGPASKKVSTRRQGTAVSASASTEAVAVTTTAAPAPVASSVRKALPVAALALVASLVFAPASSASTAAVATIDTAATAWILVSSALVLFMSIPGLALFYAGLVRAKNALSVLVHCFVLVATGTMTWLAVGYSLSFAPGTAFVGGLSKAFLSGVTQASVANNIPELLWFMFQGTFYIITPGLMVGAFVERLKLSSFLLYTSLWSILVYTPICHMVWGGGWLASLGVLDFAGGIVVHITAGVGALLTCITLGPRKQNKMTPHNLPMAITGAGMLWVGWYGFNGGSAVAAGALAASAIVVSQISASVAALTWMALDWKEKKPTSLGLITGSIAGLAAITPAAGVVGVPGALAIGLASALICRYCSTTVKAHFAYDDSLDVFGVHGVGGFVGTILLGIFGHTSLGGTNTVAIAKQLGLQSFASGFAIVYTLVVSYALLKVTAALTGGLRVDAIAENKGLDAAELGEEAYLEATA